MQINPVKIHQYDKLSFKHNNSHKNDDEEPSSKVKYGVLASSVVGVAAASAIIAKKQGFSLNPKVIFSQSPKNWAMLKVFNKNDKNAKLMEIEEEQILTLAGGSAVGGLAGGALLDDKKHLKSKFRETVSQLLGNVAVPVACVGLTSRLYKKNKDSILSKVPQLNGNGKFAKGCNKFLKAAPSAALTLVSLVAGIVGGNRLSNLINENIFNKKINREIKTSDFAPHVDDIGMAVTLMADKSVLSTSITRTVPAFLCVPGYQIGIHRD